MPMKTHAKRPRKVVARSARNHDHTLFERIARKLISLHEEAEQSQSGTPPAQPNYAKKIADKLAAAGEGGLGILTRPHDEGGLQIVLYKTNIFIGNILAYLNPATNKIEDIQAVADSADKSVVGMLTLGKPADACNDALVVKYVVSREGYGPSLYEIGMQFSPSGRIIPDRNAVSTGEEPGKGAFGIYQVFNARSDIKKKPLDDNMLPMHKRKTPDDPSDDCEVWNHKGQRPDKEILDFSYEGSKVDVGVLKQNHQEAMKILKRHVNADEWSEYLTNVSNMIFMGVYHKIPMEHRGLKQ